MTIHWGIIYLLFISEVLLFMLLSISHDKFQQKLTNLISSAYNNYVIKYIIIGLIFYTCFMAVDSYRELNKLKSQDITNTVNLNVQSYDHFHLKMFRAERNLNLTFPTIFMVYVNYIVYNLRLKVLVKR